MYRWEREQSEPASQAAPTAQSAQSSQGVSQVPSTSNVDEAKKYADWLKMPPPPPPGVEQVALSQKVVTTSVTPQVATLKRANPTPTQDQEHHETSSSSSAPSLHATVENWVAMPQKRMKLTPNEEMAAAVEIAENPSFANFVNLMQKANEILKAKKCASNTEVLHTEVVDVDLDADSPPVLLAQGKSASKSTPSKVMRRGSLDSESGDTDSDMIEIKREMI